MRISTVRDMLRERREAISTIAAIDHLLRKSSVYREAVRLGEIEEPPVLDVPAVLEAARQLEGAPVEEEPAQTTTPGGAARIGFHAGDKPYNSTQNARLRVLLEELLHSEIPIAVSDLRVRLAERGLIDHTVTNARISTTLTSHKGAVYVHGNPANPKQRPGWILRSSELRSVA